MQTKVIVLGYHVSQEGLKFHPAKIEVISHISVPMSRKEVRSFLGHVGYYRRSIENFTKIVAPMFKFLTKYVDFLWDIDCQNVVQEVKEKLSTTLELRGPN